MSLFIQRFNVNVFRRTIIILISIKYVIKLFINQKCVLSIIRAFFNSGLLKYLHTFII